MMFFYQFVEVFGQFGKFPFQLKMSSKSPDIQNRVVQNHFQEIFVADIDDPLLLRVLDPEFVGEGLQHYTSLYEIVKVDVSGAASIKHSDYSVTELGG